MPILHYETRIGRDGSITLPLLPEYCNHKIVVVVEEERSAKSTKIADRQSEEQEAAFEDFLSSWKGCMKGVPHQSAEEIRAERLEKKYGSEK